MTVGITGHMNLGPQATQKWVRDQLFDWLANHDIELGLTCLAPGTDQIFAELCQQQSIPYRAIIPCKGYGELFDHEGKAGYETALAHARAAMQLDFPPGEEAFMEAGKCVADQADVLLAVWNGQPAAGLGGTGDVVKYAQSQRLPIIHLNLITFSIHTILHQPDSN